MPTGLAQIYVALGWSPRQPAAMEVDASAFALAVNGKVREDQDLVFYNNPKIREGSVAALPDAGLARGEDVQLFALDLPNIPADIQKIAFTVTIHEGQTREQNFGMLESAWARVVEPSNGREIACFQLPLAGTPETAMIFCEVYRRQEQWKFKAVGQGYVGGLEPLAIAYGIDVAEEAEESSAEPASSEPTPPPPVTAPIAESPPAAPLIEPTPSPVPPPVPESPPPPTPAPLPSEPSAEPAPLARPIVDLENKYPNLAGLLRKAGVELEKHGLAGHAAKLALCLDISGSMHKLYDQGAMTELVRRVLGLALLVDDDAEINVFLFGAKAHHFGVVNADTCQTFVADMLARHNLEAGTNYANVMAMVRQHYQGGLGQIPVYVMFVTDGDTSDRKESERQIIAASQEGIFWQFMAIGEDSRKGFFAKILGPQFEFLTHLDSLRNRFVDNANFFLVQNPAALAEEELYRLMMVEYPTWLRAARAKGALR